MITPHRLSSNAVKTKIIENLGSTPGPLERFSEKNTSVFCGLPKSPEKPKVKLKCPVHIYIILAK
jgi:hypothetical protein